MIDILIVEDVINQIKNKKLIQIGEGETRIAYEYNNYIIKVDKHYGKYNKKEYKLFQKYNNDEKFLNSFIKCYYVSDDSNFLICEKIKPLVELLNEINKPDMEDMCIDDIAETLGFKVDWDYIYNICQITGLALEEVYDGTNYGIRNDNTLVVMDYAEFI